MMGSGAFESPLVNHARMRGLYRALVEVRELSRVARKRGWPKGFEACWVATALDLNDGDLTSDSGPRWLLEHVRRAGLRAGGSAAGSAEMKRVLKQMAGETASTKLSAAERMLCAAGQAMALRTLGSGVVMAYTMDAAMKTKDWQRVFEMATMEALPLVIVAAAGSADLTRVAKESGGNIPVIPVDAGDTLALYRVAQESIGRARTDGGVAVMECVPMQTDPVRMMGQQLVNKGICTQRWVSDIAPGVKRAVAAARAG